MTDKKFNDDTVLDNSVITKREEKVKKPRMWKVIFLNDDFTTVEFVVDMLKKHFRHSEEGAVMLAQTVHTKGSAVAGVYQFEVSETKAQAVLQEAKAKEFPLQVVLQPEKGED